MRRPPRWTNIGLIQYARILEQVRQRGIAHHLNVASWQPDGDAIRVTPISGRQFWILADRVTVSEEPPTSEPAPEDGKPADWAERLVAGATAREVIEAVQALADPADIEAVMRAELDRERSRKTVIDACEDRLADL